MSCAWGVGESPDFGSDESFGAGGPEAVVNKLRALQQSDDPVPGLLKLCHSYELLDLEGAQRDLFGEGIRLLACGLSLKAASARQAYSDALSLTCKAMQNSEDALLHALYNVLILDKIHLPEVSGEPSQTMSTCVPDAGCFWRYHCGWICVVSSMNDRDKKSQVWDCHWGLYLSVPLSELCSFSPWPASTAICCELSELMHAGIVHTILNLLVDGLQVVPRSRLPELLGMVVPNMQMLLKAIFRTDRDPNSVPLLRLDPEV